MSIIISNKIIPFGLIIEKNTDVHLYAILHNDIAFTFEILVNNLLFLATLLLKGKFLF